MNELLRYLNIYAHNFVGCNLDFMYDGQRMRVQGDELGPYVAESIIINKKFGFIKWLVDNDKINYEKVDKSWNDEMSFVDFKLDNIMEIRIKVVLMLLAISDNPIEFLCSILK